MTDPQTLIPSAELPAIFHRSPRTIRRWLAAGVLPVVRVGDATYVRRDVVDALLAPARAMESEISAATAAGEPVLSAEQLDLVHRVLGAALDSLRANAR